MEIVISIVYLFQHHDNQSIHIIGCTMNTLRNLFVNSSKTTRRNYLIAMMIFFVAAYVFMPYTGYTQSTDQTVAQESFHPFAIFGSESNFKPIEIYGLLTVLGIAIAGLLYALMLVKQVRKADQGTKKMQEIAAAVREGSNAYLAAQFKKIGPLIILITLFLYFTYTGTIDAFRWGRSGAFLVGSIFSFLVGFVGMRLATQETFVSQQLQNEVMAKRFNSDTEQEPSPVCLPMDLVCLAGL